MNFYSRNIGKSGKFYWNIDKSLFGIRTLTSALKYSIILNIEFNRLKNHDGFPTIIIEFKRHLFGRFVSGRKPNTCQNRNDVSVADAIIAGFYHPRPAVNPKRNKIFAFKIRTNGRILGCVLRTDVHRFYLCKRLTVYFHKRMKPFLPRNIGIRFQFAADVFGKIDLHPVHVSIRVIMPELHGIHRNRYVIVYPKVLTERKRTLRIYGFIRRVQAIYCAVGIFKRKIFGKFDRISVFPIPLPFIFQNLHDTGRCKIKIPYAVERLAVNSNRSNVSVGHGSRTRNLITQIQVYEISAIPVPRKPDLRYKIAISRFINADDGKSVIPRNLIKRRSCRTVNNEPVFKDDFISSFP